MNESILPEEGRGHMLVTLRWVRKLYLRTGLRTHSGEVQRGTPLCPVGDAQELLGYLQVPKEMQVLEDAYTVYERTRGSEC